MGEEGGGQRKDGLQIRVRAGLIAAFGCVNAARDAQQKPSRSSHEINIYTHTETHSHTHSQTYANILSVTHLSNWK